MVLTVEELKELTARQGQKAQARVLSALGIRFGIRPDGSLVVLRRTVETVLGAPPTQLESHSAEEPNWSSVNA